jgi:hypothetical protein
MRATITTTIALILGIAFGAPAVRAQNLKDDLKTDQPNKTAITGNRTPVARANPNKDEAQPSVPAPPEIITIDGVATASSEVAPVTGIQQEQTAPAPVPPYTITSSAEVGWRFLGTDGSFNQFRSDLNFDRGLRLLSSDLLIRPANGGGILFDSLLLNTFGWGGDPSQFLHALVEKTKVYKFDATYRRISYFSNLSNFALGQHTGDTQYQVGDFDLTLLPQNNRLKIYLGYSMDYNKGLTFTTYDYQRDEFPITAPTRTSGNDYRIGADARLWIFDLSFMQGFRYFKNDTTYTIPGFEPGNNPANSSFLTSFDRDMPVRGRVPYTRLSVHSSPSKKVDFTGRFIYTSATTRYTFIETATGNDASNNKIILDQTIVNGNAKRPNAIGDAGLTVYATDRLTFSDTFRINYFRINGGDIFLDKLLESKFNQPLPAIFLDTSTFTFEGLKQVQNSIEADYRFSKRFSAHLGYLYTHRAFDMGNFTAPPDSSLSFDPTLENNTHTVFGGFRARPVDMWTLYFDFQHGQADNVFTRVANYNFGNYRVRTVVKPTKTLAINGSLVVRNNDNPSITQTGFPQPFGVMINNRIFSTSVDWTPNSKFDLSAGYTHTHVDSDAAIIFFVANATKELGSSLYFMRDNFYFLNTRIQLHPRATLFSGFRINRDWGQGDRVPSSPTQIISSYPLTFGTPEARLSINLLRALDWNAGWQYFSYHEKLSTTRDYRAHLAYVSLTFRFNRE